MSDSTILSQMVQAAQDAADLLLRQPRPTPFSTWPEFKVRFDAADDLLSALLRERLEAARPGTAWAAELDTDLTGSAEAGANAEARELWVVDAIDGAVQYLQNLPQWSVSIALVRDGRPVLAALHSATFGHTYTAELGGGAYLDGSPAVMSAKADLSLALVGTSQPPFAGKQPEAVAATARATAALLPEVGALRNLGPTSWQVADVAAGRIDAFWEFGRDAGNLLAGALVASEAGALVTDVQGRPWHAESESFIAAPPALHARLVDLLSAGAE
jgi:myo-inositol-1(or 4)-monophosphatase